MTGIEMIRTLGSTRSVSDASARRDDDSAGFAQMLKEKEGPADAGDLKPAQDKEPAVGQTEQSDGEQTGGVQEEGQTAAGTEMDLLLAAVMLQLQVELPQQPADGVTETAVAAENAAAAVNAPAGVQQQAQATDPAAALVQTSEPAGIPAAKDEGQAPAMDSGSFSETAETENTPDVQEADSEDGTDVKQSSITARDVQESKAEAGSGIAAAAAPDQEQNPSAGDEKSFGSGGEEQTAQALHRSEGSINNRPAEFSTMSAPRPTAETVTTMKTTPAALPEDVGNALAARIPGKNGTLTIELEPVSLGKLTIKVVYDEGKAAVSILSANPKTLELLSRSAAEIAGIMEEKTGQETVIYTQEPEQRQQSYDEGRSGGRQQEQDGQEEKKQNTSESFAQQLRLGLV